MEPTDFVKQRHCAECDGALDPDDNWSCLDHWVPVAMVPGMMVQVHIHLHLKCAPPVLKWRMLSEMGNWAVQNNNLAGQGPN